ncbi:hypothetical protein A2714_02315 [Candidatus Woesebacteria bacterium RIFCSPHIGHO2_01_FULL_38_9]|uniref:Uncharacterized protein n=1 Tax=Candidatus Woesebacteria bacterium RIFCSPHIGHO2_01_FULL_38_9 TaxID=1802492 RepID=A0A1F7Y3Z2_9BACT|nr:MAG: hypothetical protein A2714_02315 [Candidatus Woesebacteria bacterium RIFCSPHIGHO2_01_FULL_38_9]
MKDTTAVVMAAGKGTRLLPLTLTVPKPLIRLLGKTPLEYNLDNIVGHVHEIVLVVGYLREKIIDYLGDAYKGTKIKYVNQKFPKGTAHALSVAQSEVRTKHVLVLNGDDIYDKDLILKTMKLENDVIVGKKDKNWKNFGILQAGKGNYLLGIVEKPERYVGDLANIGIYKMKSEIFDYFGKIKKSVRGEYEITDMITKYAKANKVEIISCNSGWQPLSHPWDLLNFAENKLKGIRTTPKGKIEKNAVIKGRLHLGKNSVIKSGAYLEGNFYIGDNCEIGPNCYLKSFGSIDDGSDVGNAVEVTRSVIGKDTKIKHLSYVGDSIIGNNVNLGAGTIISNLRHDNFPILFRVNKKLINSERRKFGTVIGDFVKTGANTTLYPGTKLDSGTTTLPGEIVDYD